MLFGIKLDYGPIKAYECPLTDEDKRSLNQMLSPSKQKQEASGYFSWQWKNASFPCLVDEVKQIIAPPSSPPLPPQ